STSTAPPAPMPASPQSKPEPGLAADVGEAATAGEAGTAAKPGAAAEAAAAGEAAAGGATDRLPPGLKSTRAWATAGRLPARTTRPLARKCLLIFVMGPLQGHLWKYGSSTRVVMRTTYGRAGAPASGTLPMLGPTSTH